jgi:hypothetical protein
MADLNLHPEFYVNDKVFTMVMLADPATGLPLGGGAGGGSLSDTVFIDNTGQLFAYRDTGTGLPTAYKIPEWTEYTPVTPIKPTSAAVSNFAVESGGHLESIDNYTKDSYGSGTVTPSTPSQFGVEGKGTAVFVTSGTWTGSIVVEYSPDGTNWFPTTYVSVSSGNVGTQFSANTSGQVNTVGFDYIRLRSSTITSGSATVAWFGSRLVSNVMLDNSLPAGSNTIGKVQVINAGGTIQDGATDTAKLTEIDQRIGKYANLKLSDIDETTTGTTYLLKQGATSADPWLLMKLVEASGITTARYAGVTNNPTITLATAWANRASLVYGLITEA